jgi:hypothetical protein
VEWGIGTETVVTQRLKKLPNSPLLERSFTGSMETHTCVVRTTNEDRHLRDVQGVIR